VPPSQIGWPAMIYVAETDERAREEFEPHFWTSPWKHSPRLRDGPAAPRPPSPEA